ncbi:MAG: squalene synthase HpnC [Planctomycetaceae bacterium]
MSGAFLQELDVWGPEAADRRTVSLAEARDYCARLTRTHYENFPIVSWLLPRKLHRHFEAVYAFCRWADDLGDEVGDTDRSSRLLAWWREELAACYAGEARHPVFVALAETVRERMVPMKPFEDLISAFEQDQRILEYDTFPQLRDYCRRSADPVGRLVLYVCGEFDEQNAQWSDSICTGLQLANFWQDVARDHDIGRVYLPREDRERFGYTAEMLARRETNPAFLELMRFEVARARELLLAGLPLIDRLPGRLQVDIDLFARGGLKILERIERIDYRVWETRPVVTKRDAAGLFAKSAVRAVVRCPLSAMRRRRRLTEDERPTTDDDALSASFAWCRALAKRTAGNFYYSFLTLPRERRRDMCALYAFMRVSDDIGDEAGDSIAERQARLAEWREDVAVALDRRPPIDRCEPQGPTNRERRAADGGSCPSRAHPLWPALSDIVRRHGIPSEHLFAVLDGVRMDLDGARFETFADLERYCYHVAGAVGLCCIHVWGFDHNRADEARRAAIDCGLAFQLTNILRDLKEDAAAGRVYLPLEDLARFGYPPARIATGERNAAFAELMRFEVARARAYYARAERLFDLLEPAGRPILKAMLRIYGGLLDEIERRGYDVYSSRVALPRHRKLWIALAALLRRA